MNKINNINISEMRRLVSPKTFKNDLKVDDNLKDLIVNNRQTVRDILSGKDERLMAIVGPCSIHDTKIGLEYAKRLAALQKKYQEKLFIVMRVYFEKPRTTIGWRGLITDPYLDGSYRLEDGLKLARKFLLDVNSLGLPTGSEILDPIVPQYISDLISWASIGARTTESQTHREITSGLSMAVGFKNSTDGSFTKAVNAIESGKHAHSFIGIDEDGITSILKTAGNQCGHLILRGGDAVPNYYEENIEDAQKLMEQKGLDPAIIIDCSHANSRKIWANQERVLRSILDQRKRGLKVIKGFMLESNINEGNQSIPENKSDLKYGVSITDGCIGWEKTEELLERAADNG